MVGEEPERDTPPTASSGDDLLRRIPKDVLDQIPDAVRAMVVESVLYQGQLPPPWMLAEFDKIVPGSAGGMVDMVKKEQDHRIAWEKRSLDIFESSTRRGQH